jgi:TPR repeat protein
MIDPSLPAAEQLARAVELVDGGDKTRARNTIALLMEEGYEEAEWLLGNWFLTGKAGIVPQNERNAVILIENAAKVGHVEAAKWMGMARWYGQHGMSQDRKVGLNYMRIAARFGDEEATLILRSMLAEPERQRRAERARQIAEAAKQQRSMFSGWLAALSSRSWSSSTRTGISSSQRAANASWQRHQTSMDNLYFNQRMDYLTGSSTACNYSNPYC